MTYVPRDPRTGAGRTETSRMEVRSGNCFPAKAPADSEPACERRGVKSVAGHEHARQVLRGNRWVNLPTGADATDGLRQRPIKLCPRSPGERVRSSPSCLGTLVVALFSRHLAYPIHLPTSKVQMATLSRGHRATEPNTLVKRSLGTGCSHQLPQGVTLRRRNGPPARRYRRRMHALAPSPGSGGAGSSGEDSGGSGRVDEAVAVDISHERRRRQRHEVPCP